MNPLYTPSDFSIPRTTSAVLLPSSHQPSFVQSSTRLHDEVCRELVVARPDHVVRMAVTGFLAGYSDLTRDAYALDLRSFWRCCGDHGLGL